MERVVTNPGILLLGLLLLTLALSYFSNYFLSRIFLGQTYRYLVAPGVVVHEYSHAVACVLAGAKIRQIKVFEPTGGQVVHEEPRLPFGQGLISVAPIFGAAVTVYLLAQLLVPTFLRDGELAISSWQFYLFVYLGATIAATMAPSTTDLKAGAASYVVFCIMVGLAAEVGPVANYFAAIAGDSYDAFWNLLIFIMVILGGLAVASAVAYGILHRTTRQGTHYTAE